MLVGRREAVRISALPHRIDTLKLDGEVRRAAVVLRIEPIGLATGRRSDLDHLHTDSAQAVDDRLARGARIGTRQNEYPRQAQRGQGLSRRHRKTLRGGVEQCRRERISRHRIGRGMLVVELDLLEGCAA